MLEKQKYVKKIYKCWRNRNIKKKWRKKIN